MHLLKVSTLNLYYGIEFPFAMEELCIISTDMEGEISFFDLDFQFRGLIVLFGKQGQVHFTLNQKPYILQEGGMAMILPEMAVEFKERSSDFAAQVLVMSYDFIETFAILPELINNTEVLNMPISYANALELASLNELTQLILRHYAQPKNINLKQQIQYLIFALLTAVSKSYQSLTVKENLQKNRVNAITDSFFNLLHEYGSLERQVSFYADRLYLTPQHLSSLIKKRTGKSVKSWIGFAVINKAKEYLNNTPLSIKEISDLLEFADASLFCRYFKRSIGQTPNEYRNQE